MVQAKRRITAEAAMRVRDVSRPRAESPDGTPPPAPAPGPGGGRGRRGRGGGQPGSGGSSPESS